MDGKGRCMDNIFVERLWRSLKYEEVYLHAYVTVAEAKAGIGAWISFYNQERQHQSLGYRAPRQVYEEACGYVDEKADRAFLAFVWQDLAVAQPGRIVDAHMQASQPIP